jgi:hypothetical protein
MSEPRFFNTTGPVNPAWHYCVPPLSRLDMGSMMQLLAERRYFVLHAPRQSGKTTCLKALVAHLNGGEDYRACYMNVEAGQGPRDDTEQAFKLICAELVRRARDAGEPRLEPLLGELTRELGAPAAFAELLNRWARLDPKPLVVVLDEADALVGDTLVTLLRALRAGYDTRPSSFPSSVILCGIRDVRDYRMTSTADKSVITGGSAFNIKAKSLRLGDFERREVEELLGQHTAETGQAFSAEAVEAIWDLTLGQPWLVNALAYETCFEDPRGRVRSRTVDAGMVQDAKEALILRRDTHLDQLADKLREPRVREVIEPILLGSSAEVAPDDKQYCVDLGLVRDSPQGVMIANPIYREVVPRELVLAAQERLKTDFTPDWVKADGTLDVTRLLELFREFYLENGEAWAGRMAYREAGPLLLMQAFLQRVVNGRGRVEREYALGTRRTDLYLRWPHPSGVQKAVFELKILRRDLTRTIADGLEQVTRYAERCEAAEAHLLIFTKNQKLPKRKRVFLKRMKHSGHTVTVWGM